MSWENISDSLEDKKIKIIIEEKGNNKPILEVLSGYLQYYDKEQWENFFKENKVNIIINNKQNNYNTILKEKDEVILLIKQEAEPQVNKDYKIIYEDEYILAINKPSNLPMHPSGRFHGNTLINMLKKQYPNLKTINRLDRQTSGIVIFAKDDDTTKHLANQFSQRNVEKRYIAVVKGECDINKIIDEPIKQSTYKDICKIMIVAKDGKESQTKVRTMHKSKEKSILECKPITGRTHQIRVHLNHIGHPAINDTLYGNNPQEFLDELNNKTKYKPLMLHCQELTIINPQTKEKQTFEAMVPRYML